MTCEYFAFRDGKILCRVYGMIDITPEKIEECLSDCEICSRRASQFSADERTKDVVLERHFLELVDAYSI